MVAILKGSTLVSIPKKTITAATANQIAKRIVKTTTPTSVSRIRKSLSPTNVNQIQKRMPKRR